MATCRSYKAVRRRSLSLVAAMAAVAPGPTHGFHLPASCGQCVLVLAESWTSSHAEVSLFSKRGGRWMRDRGPWPARLGRKGLAWGLGLHPPPPAEAPLKREGDQRAPAGVFEIGGAWGNEAEIPRHPRLPYTQVTPRDLWIEDPSSPLYNRHVRLGHEPASAWEKKQQMKQDDPAHHLKLFIAHNAAARVVPGAGSAIFFHIWRDGGRRPSSGCVVLEESRLRQLVAWLQPDARPIVVILPRGEYGRLREVWRLP